MYEVGRLCIKIAGRDARKKCVIVDVLDELFVLIDGQTRRKKCNIKHLEPLEKIIKIKKGASHSEVVTALKKEKINVVVKKKKPAKKKPTKTLKKSETPKTKKKKN
jgi:large subunit ribosomal protein L14e